MKDIKAFNQGKQSELFGSCDLFSINFSEERSLELTKDSILKWRGRIDNHQKKILANLKDSIGQRSIISSQDSNFIEKINPFSLKGFSINFWRSNKSVSDDPAIYFVIDNLRNSQIILYIGETYAADKRWKGEHDCKFYINNYKESLAKNKIDSYLDIRFFLDVPKEVKLRRKLEQQLIYLWLPPFNKETRNRWSTTFTNY